MTVNREHRVGEIPETLTGDPTELLVAAAGRSGSRRVCCAR
jgi:hypothetical protein